MTFRLNKQSADRRGLARALEDYCRANQVPAEARQAADLALEEHLTNVLAHAWDDGLSHEAIVRFAVEGGFLSVEVLDDGRPFNPLEAPAVDTSIPLEKKPIGGLGIHLMRQFMDELNYRREGGQNVLRMRKRVKQT